MELTSDRVTAATPVIIAVDGGGTKTQVAVMTKEGHLLSSATGGVSNAQTVGADVATANLADTVDCALAAAAEAGPIRVEHAALYMSGLDLPAETEALAEAISGLPWAVPSMVLGNDMQALLRAGTSEPNAIAVVCGTGNNAIGVREDGTVERFLALGSLSGDWGGGWQLGQQGLWHAARSEDGRGEQTVLAETLPAALGFANLSALIEALHFGTLSERTLGDLAPAIVAAAEAGDPVALRIIDRQSKEIADFVRALARRLDLEDQEIPVVLGGGVIAAREPVLMAAIARDVSAVAPKAHIEFVSHRPIVGAGLLALEQVGAQASALETAAEALEQLD